MARRDFWQAELRASEVLAKRKTFSPTRKTRSPSRNLKVYLCEMISSPSPGFRVVC